MITEPLSITIPIESFGLYAVSVTARCQSGKLLDFRGGENVRVEIDGTYTNQYGNEANIFFLKL